jgi:hypothetical protein
VFAARGKLQIDVSTQHRSIEQLYYAQQNTKLRFAHTWARDFRVAAQQKSNGSEPLKNLRGALNLMNSKVSAPLYEQRGCGAGSHCWASTTDGRTGRLVCSAEKATGRPHRCCQAPKRRQQLFGARATTCMEGDADAQIDPGSDGHRARPVNSCDGVKQPSQALSIAACSRSACRRSEGQWWLGSDLAGAAADGYLGGAMNTKASPQRCMMQLAYGM